MGKDSSGYHSGHEFLKRHLRLVLDGVLETELADGRKAALASGTSSQIDNRTASRRSAMATGERRYAVD
jgi:hypothetical protein